MLDIRQIVENKDEVIANLSRRNKDYSEEINKACELQSEYLKLLKVTEDAKAVVNEKSKLIGQYKRDGKDISPLMAEINEAKANMNIEKVSELQAEITEILMSVPNTVHPDTPVGKDEDENVEIKKWGEPRQFDFTPRPHYEVGEIVDGLDFERASKIAKSRFVITKGLVARLERAIMNFMLDTHTENGYTEFGIPVIVSDKTLRGSGQLPKFGEDLFKLGNGRAQGESDDEFADAQNGRDFYLIPTAEVVLANLHQNEILTFDELTAKYTAYSQCFRKEAGSAGKDTRGMIRVHEFGKVELFKYTHPADSYAELDTMVQDAERILQQLELPYRVLDLCTGDLGVNAKRTYDLEVWFPSQEKYRECSSCSNVEDFQARRAKIRFKDEDGKTKYVHMLNGSGMATGRILAAILENYQNEDGTIEIPQVLRKYM